MRLKGTKTCRTCQAAITYWVRPVIVMAPAVGLTLKGHGRDRTLNGLAAASRDRHGR